MNREQLVKVLSHQNITIVKSFDDKPSNIDRIILFEIENKQYKIVWFCNVMTLYIDKFFMRFHEVEQSGTWPNNAKRNLQFDYGGETVGVIPIEYYREDN